MSPLESLAAFMKALPDWAPSSEIRVEFDGAFGLDWMVIDGTSTRCLSVSSGNDLVYAWADRHGSDCGVADFDGQTIPLPILERLQVMYGRMDSPKC